MTVVHSASHPGAKPRPPTRPMMAIVSTASYISSLIVLLPAITRPRNPRQSQQSRRRIPPSHGLPTNLLPTDAPNAALISSWTLATMYLSWKSTRTNTRPTTAPVKTSASWNSHGTSDIAPSSSYDSILMDTRTAQGRPCAPVGNSAKTAFSAWPVRPNGPRGSKHS